MSAHCLQEGLVRIATSYREAPHVTDMHLQNGRDVLVVVGITARQQLCPDKRLSRLNLCLGISQKHNQQFLHQFGYVGDADLSAHDRTDSRRHLYSPQHNHESGRPWSEKRSANTAAACGTNNIHPISVPRPHTMLP